MYEFKYLNNRYTRCFHELLLIICSRCFTDQIFTNRKCLGTIFKMLVMRFFFIACFLFLTIMHVSARLSHAQHISINRTDAPLSAIFDEIRNQSGYDFFMNMDLLKTAKPVTIHVRNASLEEVLEKCFENQPLIYEIKENKTVVVLDRPITKGNDKFSGAPYIASQQIVRGKVTTIDNEPLVGVSVLEKGTQNGSITNGQGEFSISIKDGPTVLIVRYVGFLSKEVPVQAAYISIILEEDRAALSEVVVVGYGTQKKVNLTGAVSSIDFSEVAETRPVTSLSTGLAGLSAGIQVKQSTGQPGSDGATLRIRGQGTLNNSDPLVLVDGVPSDMNDVNPQDVDNISILKDAASAAIYGSRAANGVILVTTKRGAAGKSSISYNVRTSQQTPSNLIEMVSDYPRHMELINEGFNNLTPNSGPFQQSTIDEWRANSAADPIRYPNTDWLDWILQRNWSQEHHLSATGGNDKTTYLISANYLDNPGIVENAGFKRYGARVNVESEVNDWLTVGSTSFGLWSNAGLTNITDLFSFTAASVPGILPRDPQGRYGSAMAPGENLQANNYLHDLNSIQGDLERQKVFSRLYGNIAVYKGLRLESGFSIDLDNEVQRSNTVYIPRWNFQTEQITNPNPARNNVYNAHRRDFQYVMNHVLKYNSKIGEHSIDVLAGYQEEYYRSNNFNARMYDLLDELTPVLDAATSDPVAGGNATDWALRSFFGRLNYNFNERYLFEANMRYDGSSRFARARRWGAFPSFSAGWRISQEEFMKDVSLINDLKIRASWGSLGNNSIGNYDYQASYGAANYSFGGTIVSGLAPLAISNDLLTWEKTNVTNIGIDAALLNNRFIVELDLFNRSTENILVDLPIPLVNGIPINSQGVLQSPNQNAAVVRNRGGEIHLGWKDKIGEVSYSVNANYTYVRNRVMTFKGDEFSLSDQNILLEGHPIWAFYVRRVDRIVQEEDLPYIGQLVADGYTFQPNIPQPGDFLYVDANGDRRFNEDDREILDASHNPTSLFGLNLSGSYKGISLQVLLQGQAGNKAYWQDGYRTTGVRNGYLINQQVADDHWTPDNPDARYPRLVNETYSQNTSPASDFWLQDASFLRVKNIQLGYALPALWMDKLHVRRLFIYANAENLMTFTNYEGIDPEITDLGAVQTRYPTMKQITFGLNVTF